MPGPDNLFEVTLSGTLNGQFVQNVLHVALAPFAGSADPFLYAAALALSVTDEYVPAYLSCLPETYNLSSVRTRGVTPSPSATATNLIAIGDGLGARAGECSTYVSGPLLIFPTTLTRQVIGKIFLPGVSEEDISYGVLDSVLVTALNGLVVVLMTAQHASGTVAIDYQFVVANGDKSDWAIPAGGTVSPTIGTQRRRAKPIF